MNEKIKEAILVAMSEIYWAGVSAGHPLASSAHSKKERSQLTESAIEEITAVMKEIESLTEKK